MDRTGKVDVLRLIRQGAEEGLGDALEHLLEESNRRAPKDTRELVDSGYTRQQGATGVVAYDSEYAVAQHERLDYQHPSGGEAKFLESAFNTERNAVMDRAQEAIRTRLRGA